MRFHALPETGKEVHRQACNAKLVKKNVVFWGILLHPKQVKGCTGRHVVQNWFKQCCALGCFALPKTGKGMHR